MYECNYLQQHALDQKNVFSVRFDVEDPVIVEGSHDSVFVLWKASDVENGNQALGKR